MTGRQEERAWGWKMGTRGPGTAANKRVALWGQLRVHLRTGFGLRGGPKRGSVRRLVKMMGIWGELGLNVRRRSEGRNNGGFTE